MKIDLFDFEKTVSALTEKLQGWIEQFFIMLPNIFAALVVVFLFYIIAKFVSRFFNKILDRVSTNKQINSLLSSILYFAVICCGIFVALGILKLDKTVTSLLAGVGILGLALGFAFQDLAANFMAGILISLGRPFKIGELISSNGFLGFVREIKLRSTTIHSLEGQSIMIPNKEVFGNPLINYSALKKRRVSVAVGVSYDANLEEVRELTSEAIKKLDFVDNSQKVEVLFKEFGGSSIDLEVQFWIKLNTKLDFPNSKSEAIICIKKLYDEKGISIPFPIRTLDFEGSGLSKHLGSNSS